MMSGLYPYCVVMCQCFLLCLVLLFTVLSHFTVISYGLHLCLVSLLANHVFVLSI